MELGRGLGEYFLDWSAEFGRERCDEEISEMDSGCGGFFIRLAFRFRWSWRTAAPKLVISCPSVSLWPCD